jgi:hypothetical protein
MARFLILFSMLYFSFQAVSAEAVSHIQINIRHYQDSVLLMTSYYGDKVILIDTAYASHPGVFVFEREEKLPGGIYMAVSPAKRKLFEFVIGGEQDFSLTTDTVNYTGKMYVKGSEENQVFFDYMKYNEQLYFANRTISDELAKTAPGTDRHAKLLASADSLNKAAATYKLDIIENKPNLFVSKMFNAMREVEIPDDVRNSSDSSSIYYYYKNHYWDYLPLDDSSLLRTPLLARKVDEYIRKLVFTHPDSTILEVTRLIEMARPANEVFSWLCWHFLSVYQNPDYMGFDKVFIYLVDVYFSKEELTNLTPSIRQNLQDRAEIMRPLLLGSEAPNLILIDTTGKYQSFLSLPNEYIILFFWDIECGICKKEIEGLKTLLANSDHDVEVFAISVNADLDKWKESLIEKDFTWVNVNGTRSVTQDFHDLYDISGTPALFVLDKNRNIIAKHLSADQIQGFLDNYSSEN